MEVDFNGPDNEFNSEDEEANSEVTFKMKAGAKNNNATPEESMEVDSDEDFGNSQSTDGSDTDSEGEIHSKGECSVRKKLSKSPALKVMEEGRGGG